jgi:2-oxoglutarate ferredoxin oxidoreductase subunit delta
MFFNHKHTQTLYVQLDTQKCKACWKCIRICSGQVISKLNLPFHKHVLIVKPGACTGCLNCVKICRHNAFTTNNTEQKTEEHNKFILTSIGNGIKQLQQIN